MNNEVYRMRFFWGALGVGRRLLIIACDMFVFCVLRCRACTSAIHT